ncbi:MAG TPA: hypothetical protein VFQ44_21275 [Streptosporangiaceae bacterium]|nr:hypothetical protein [Streptosporangiaceae bacterium]
MARFTARQLHVVEAAAVVVIALGVAVGPGLARAVGHVVTGGAPKLGVTRLAPTAREGIVASGTIAGKPWQIEVMRASSFAGTWQCAPAARFATYCQIGINRLWGKIPDGQPAMISAAGQTLLGRVRADVRRIRVRLSDNVIIDLHPVVAYGRHWVGLVFPTGASVSMVTAYAHGEAIAHNTPYIPVDGNYEFLSWLPPGVDGPAIETKPINPQIVPGDELSVGPWGNCVGWPDRFICWPLGVPYMSGSIYAFPHAPLTPRSVVMAVRPNIAYMQLRFSNGASRRIHVVYGAGVGFVAYKVRSKPLIVSWGLYSASGRKLFGGAGPPDSTVMGT